MNPERELVEENPPSPSPSLSPMNSPGQRRFFLVLVMKHTQLIPPHLRVDGVRRIMCELFTNFGLYEEGGAGNGLYCAYCTDFDEGEFRF